MAHFEKELMELRSRAASSHVSIGTKEEFGGVRQQTDEMWLFLTDIKSTTQVPVVVNICSYKRTTNHNS